MFFFVLIASMFFINCSKEQQYVEENQTTDRLAFNINEDQLAEINILLQQMNNENSVSYIGQSHNAALNKILVNLTNKQSLASYKNDHNVFIHELKSETLNWLRAETELPEDFDVHFYTEVFEETGFHILKHDIRKLPLIAPEDEKYWNAAQLKILKSLDSVVSDADCDILSILARIKNIENTLASSGLDEQKKNECLAMTSIASNSMVYWYTRSITPSDPFEEVLHTEEGYSWKGMGKADLGGAITGAVRTAFLALIAPVSWKIWAVNIIGTGVGASAAYGVIWLID